MSIYQQNLQGARGATFSFRFAAWLESSLPVNLTGYSATLVIGVGPALLQGLVQLTTTLSSYGQVVLGGTTGVVTVNLTPAGMSSLSSLLPETAYVYALQLVDPSGNVVDFARGAFVVSWALPVPQLGAPYTTVTSVNSPLQMLPAPFQTVEFQSSGGRLVALTPPSPLLGSAFRAVWSQDSGPSPPPQLNASDNGATIDPWDSPGGSPTGAAAIVTLGGSGQWAWNGTLWRQVA